jgi:hypothetical protein
LVEKINFSEENKERLEELTKSKPELWEIYRYKYFNETVFAGTLKEPTV